jgi:hypothetical protein
MILANVVMLIRFPEKQNNCRQRSKTPDPHRADQPD